MTRAIYIRTSTEDQHGAGQEDALYRAALGRGWGEPAHEYATFKDVGHSGAKASRPALDLLKREVVNGRVREVMVFALDRLGRSLLDVVKLLTDWTAAGCAVVSLREALDFTTPAGRLQAQLFAAFAEFEREVIRGRVNSGLTAARARGVKLGRPRRVSSWSPEELRDMCSGRPRRDVAREIGVPESTLRRWLELAPNTPPNKEAADRIVAGVCEGEK